MVLKPMGSRSFMLLLTFMFSHFFWAQQQKEHEDPSIERQLLLEDLEVLKRNLELAQPGLYNYTPKKEMDAFFNEVKSAIDRDLSSIDFFRLIAPLSNKIRNGHTILVPSSAWEDAVITQMKLLPLDLYHYKGAVYVMHNLSDNESIKEGSLLKSINGKPAKEVYDAMVDRWFKDGYNLSRPREIVEEEFRFLYAHFYGTTDNYTLDIEIPDGSSTSLKVNGIQETTFKERLQQRYQLNYVPWWRRSPKPLAFHIEGKRAYLKVTQFSNGVKGENGKRFGNFIKSAFKTISARKIPNLILDLRGNQGGNVKPQLELLRHLVPKPFHLYGEVHANVKKLPDPKYYQFDVISRAEFKNNFSNEKISGVYPMKNRPGFDTKPQAPASNLFQGKLYVLIDGWSFSATGEVCGIIKEHMKDAIFLGEETGGNPVTNISGIQTFMTLPHSKNRILICLVSYSTAVSFKNDGHGVQPQYELRNSVEEMRAGRDVVLEKVEELIAQDEN